MNKNDKLIWQRKRMLDPAYRKMMCEAAKKSQKKHGSDPEWRARVKASGLKSRSAPERRARKAAYDKKYRAANAARKKLNDRAYYIAHREKALAYSKERGRQAWHRMGSGRHASRVHGWATFFARLNNDTDRAIAAHVMMCFANFDNATYQVVTDRWFDYNVLADAVENP